jgi:hypothetical protein
MAYTPVEIPSFGGLNLRVDPQQVGVSGAVDLMNVLLDRTGRLRTRDGYASFAAAGPASCTPLLVMSQPSVTYAAGGAPSPLVNLFTVHRTSAGKLGINVTSQAGSLIYNYTTAWDASSTEAYAAVSTGYGLYFTSPGSQNMARVDVLGDHGTDVAGVGGGPLAMTATDFRLVSCYQSRVKFSDPGNGTVFGVNNYVDLDPGDSELIAEAVTWNTYTFIFKQSKFFVYTGTSVDGSGNPIFNYRAVRSGQGVRDAGGALATAEGVYFVNDAGVWLTTGGPPRKVSGAIDDLFQQNSLPYTSSSVTNIIANGTIKRLAASRRQLYVFTGAGTLAMDRESGAWTAHSFAPTYGDGWNTTSLRPVPESNEDLVFIKSGSVNAFKFAAGTITDAGASISASYRTGFWTPGQPGAETIIRETLVDGSGTVTLKSSSNDTVALGTGVSLTLGTSPAVAQSRDRRAVRGRNVSVEFSGTAPWSVSRAIANVHGQDAPGSKAA